VQENKYFTIIRTSCIYKTRWNGDAEIISPVGTLYISQSVHDPLNTSATSEATK